VPTPDDGDLLDFMLAAAPEENARKLILADNPAKLYGWPRSGPDEFARVVPKT
jgi:hypothetical protein